MSAASVARPCACGRDTQRLRRPHRASRRREGQPSRLDTHLKENLSWRHSSPFVHPALDMIPGAMPRRVGALCPTVLLLVVVCGCASGGGIDPQDSAQRLAARTGAEPRVGGARPPEVPPGIRLDDGLTPDEAVALALWNNAAFQVSVAELGFARADLLDAGLLANPVLSLAVSTGTEAARSHAAMADRSVVGATAARRGRAAGGERRRRAAGADRSGSGPAVRVAHADFASPSIANASPRETAAILAAHRRAHPVAPHRRRYRRTGCTSRARRRRARPPGGRTCRARHHDRARTAAGFSSA